MDAIPGPYKFDDEAPKHLMGWLPDEVPKATQECAPLQTDFKITGPPPPQPPLPIWIFSKQLNYGKHLPTFEQLIGDCVAAGVSQAGARLQVAEIAKGYQEEILRPWFVPFIYGISRVQIGGGNLDGDGSTGAWGAAAVKQYGVLFDNDHDVPKYSAAIGRNWGRRPGPPNVHQDTAQNRPVKTTSKLKTVSQIREALCSYYPVTIASAQGFKMKPFNLEEYHVFEPFGSWMHQMSLIAWMDEPFRAAYRLNSWGPNAHGTPLNGEPPGGAWCLIECLEEELRQQNTEVYTYSNFDGFPSAPNLALIR